MRRAAMFLAMYAAATSSCSEATDGADGKGNVTFTTYGESFIEEKIGPGGTEAAPIVDGFTVTYDRFLIVIGDVAVAEEGSAPVARMSAPKLFDMKRPGAKAVVTFADLPGKPYRHVSYAVAPAMPSTELGEGAVEGDRQLMIAGGFSLYVEGKLTKDAVTKTFAWGFKTNTLYDRCEGELAGKSTEGVVVTNGGSDTVELTIHGDHLFYDDLQAPDAKVRGAHVANADANGDGAVTLDELGAVPLASIGRELGPFGTGSAPDVNDLRAFVEGLSRTVGHFRGEGECLTRAR